jgi:hypothetical protein
MAENLNWEEFRRCVRTGLWDRMQGLFKGCGSDLQVFVAAISVDITEAARLGKPALINELVGQLEAVAELNRLRLVDGCTDTVQEYALNVVGVAMALAV